MSLKGRTIFITGASRGIGLAVALRAAQEGANIIVAAKTNRPHPKLPGTIHTAAAAVEQAGGKALPVVLDVRDEGAVATAVERAAATFGGIDVLVNNASAISLTGTLATPPKIFDRMMSVNTRGTFLCSQACIPHLKRSPNPHILNLAPPLNMDARWFAPHVAYTMAKYGMSLCVLGMAREFERDGIAVNALWPRTAIATSAIEFAVGNEALLRFCRRPAIVADAACWILSQPARELTGQFLIDDEVLSRAGVDDFAQYQVEPGAPLALDFFLESAGPHVQDVISLPGR